MAGSLFSRSWFSGQVLGEISKLLQGQPPADDAERRLMAGIFWYLHEAGDRQTPSYDEMVRFFAFTVLNKHQSTAQLHQDLWALFMTGGKREGFFVEFGACDGKFLSNTWLLETAYAWRGILAEPNPVWHDDLATNRSCAISDHCIHGSSGLEVEFTCTTQPELSRLTTIAPNDVHERMGTRATEATIKVRTISLMDLLQQHNAPRTIDYLSIDTEGSELAILETMDFSRYRIELITVEHAGEVVKREKIAGLLARQGYRRWFPHYTRWDDWYVRE